MMGQNHHRTARDDGYVVRRPRATDALGDSLRHAFGDPMRLPEDIARVLAKLERAAPSH